MGKHQEELKSLNQQANSIVLTSTLDLRVCNYAHLIECTILYNAYKAVHARARIVDMHGAFYDNIVLGSSDIHSYCL